MCRLPDFRFVQNEVNDNFSQSDLTKNRFMHTVHFSHSFSKLSETFIYDYVISLDDHGVGVEVVTLNHVNKEDRPFDEVSELKLPLWNVPRLWNFSRDVILGRKTEISSWPVYRKRLKKILRRKKPDILHAHFGPMGVFLAPVAKELGIPLVVTFYGYDISELLEQEFWQKAYLDLAKVADRVTVLSKEMKNRALSIGFSNAQTDVVHLGTKVESIEYQEPSSPAKNFLSVGRLSEKKGHLDSLIAFNSVLETSTEPITYKIIGEGEGRAGIESFIESNGLSDNVILMGSLPHSEVVKEFYKADVFVLNSKTSDSGDKEGTPTVLAEAQAAGLPCLSTFHSGIPEMIPVENHFLLAEEGNTDQMAVNMKRVIEASQEKIKAVSHRGREFIEDNFDVKKEALKFKTIYQELSQK
jgi:glycosyltransferase involved in cell wall biosynthesis